jgi:hypothetical protein
MKQQPVRQESGKMSEMEVAYSTTLISNVGASFAPSGGNKNAS